MDLAKDVFELAVADAHGRMLERQRLSRSQFVRFFENRTPCLVIMEACGTAHHWARTLKALGHAVRLLPVQYVVAYRRRNKTDRADCAALLQAARHSEIREVAVKSIEQQTIQHLHRVRNQWMRTRTNRINVIRGIFRELGVAIPLGAVNAQRRATDFRDALPERLRPVIAALLAEIRALEARMAQIEDTLAQYARETTAVKQLYPVSGIGLLTATAMVAAVGDPSQFRNGRHLAAWLGLTPREHSSGTRRRLGAISKRGDVYVRTLLTHGARAVLARAQQLAKAGKPLNRLQRWGLAVEARAGHNKAACALANKLARIAWATWYHGREFDGNFAPPRAPVA